MSNADMCGDVREAAHRLIDGLPEDATWDDVMYRVYVRQAVEAGLRDADEGRLIDVSEVRRQFGLAK
jgi:predicted transcriptional regulator